MTCREEMFRGDSPGKIYVCCLPKGHEGPHKDRCGDGWNNVGGISLFGACLAIVLAACTPSNPGPAPMPPDASDGGGDPCLAACARLAALQCNVYASTCPVSLHAFEDSRMARVTDGGSVRCVDLAGAGSAGELLKLGVHCGQ